MVSVIDALRVMSASLAPYAVRGDSSHASNRALIFFPMQSMRCFRIRR